MSSIFQLTTRPNADLFFQRNDPHDVRLGELVSFAEKDYEQSEIVILGCPQDEGVRRNAGRLGAALAPDAIRRQFYKLSNFGINVTIFDLGNTIIQTTLEETHDRQIEIVRQLIRDGKQIISLGGGNDVSYPDCRALSEEIGASNVLAFNIDAHFDVRADNPRNSGTPYRQLLEENWIEPQKFYELGYQPQVNSPIYFDYLNNLGVATISLDSFRSQPNLSKYFYDFVCSQIAEHCSQSGYSPLVSYFGFDVDSVRASDAPGVSASNPAGLTAEEFIALAEIAAKPEIRTAIIEFTETNPNFDIDNHTTKLVTIAMHRFCAAVRQNAV